MLAPVNAFPSIVIKFTECMHRIRIFFVFAMIKFIPFVFFDNPIYFREIQLLCLRLPLTLFYLIVMLDCLQYCLDFLP